MAQAFEMLMSEKAKNLAKKHPRLLSKKQLEFLKAEYQAIEKAFNERKKELEAANPFYYYSPVTGNISNERVEFLREYLKPDDIPQKLYGAIDVHLSESNIRGASGGNQSSKTTLGCIEAIIKATGVLPYCFDPTVPTHYKWSYPKKRLARLGPQHVRVIGEDYQNGILRNLLPTYRKWAPTDRLAGQSFDKAYSAGEQTLRFIDPKTKELTGSIEFMSNQQELGTFAGPARHFLVLDEEPRREVYKENLMRFTTASELDVLFTMTPDDGMSWTYDLYTRGQDQSGNKVEWFQIPSVCNPHANIRVLREILGEMQSYEELKMRLLGEYVSLSGLVYGKLFQPQIHVIEPFETGCTCGFQTHLPDCPYTLFLGYLGVDAHMVKESCATMAFIDSEDNFFVDTCYKKSVDTNEFKSDLKRLTYGKRMDWTVFDPSNDSSLTVFQGVNIFKMMTTGENRVPRAFKGDKFAGSIAAGVNTIKERMKLHPITQRPRFYIFNRPENQELIKSMKSLQRDVWANEDIKGMRDKIQEGVHDHHAAMRYILQNKLVWKPYMPAEILPPLSDMEAMLA
jgi:hypothetical protein